MLHAAPLQDEWSPVMSRQGQATVSNCKQACWAAQHSNNPHALVVTCLANSRLLQKDECIGVVL